MERILIRGDIATSSEEKALRTYQDHWIVIEDGIIRSIEKDEPDLDGEKLDYRGHLIVPGLYDLHIHAPQYQYAGLHMDLELLEWLNSYTFPEEAKYIDADYADKAYTIFAEDIRKSETARLCCFGTIHRKADTILAGKLEEAGLSGFVGKVNMDRNSPEYLSEDTDESYDETVRFIEDMNSLKNIKPIITPRFIPSCSDELSRKLGRLAVDKGIPVQSHLDENLSEIEWVKELCPWADSYSSAYDEFGLFGTTPTVMAHAVWMDEDEMDLMSKRRVYVAHSPSSNANISSGIAPVREFLSRGIHLGLATDIAGGSSTSLFRVMTEAIQHSKLRWRLYDQSHSPLTFEEAFYIATRSAGSFFGKAGAIEKGFDADILVLDDRDARTTLRNQMTIAERLEWYSYRTPGDRIKAKLVQGRRLI